MRGQAFTFNKKGETPSRELLKDVILGAIEMLQFTDAPTDELNKTVLEVGQWLASIHYENREAQ